MVQNLADLPFASLVTFAAVARHLRFARAAEELRVTPTAVSKMVNQLEARLQARLFNRTTRSVALTEAGLRLAARITPALEQLKAGVEEAGVPAGEASGTVRLNTSYVAYATFVEPRLPAFFGSQPFVQLDVSLDNVAGDIVGRGFDLGIRPGRGVQRDMISLPLSGAQRLVVVGAPSYFRVHPRPKTPASLLEHPCVRQRIGPERWLEWTLVEKKKQTTIEVRGPLQVDEMRSAVRAAVSGIALAYVFEDFVAAELKARRLEVVLEAHALPREPFFLYYPSRRQLPLKLRVLIEHLRRPVASSPQR